MRTAVVRFIALGSLPDADASVAVISSHQEALLAITKPVTDIEATGLLPCFGPDDCHGLAWTLLHLIESAPRGCQFTSPPPLEANEWHRRLWERSQRGQMVDHHAATEATPSDDG